MLHKNGFTETKLLQSGIVLPKIKLLKAQIMITIKPTKAADFKQMSITRSKVTDRFHIRH